jgi:hypothetical protein
LGEGNDLTASNVGVFDGDPGDDRAGTNRRGKVWRGLYLGEGLAVRGLDRCVGGLDVHD